MKKSRFWRFLNLTKIQGYWYRQGFIKLAFAVLFGFFAYHVIAISSAEKHELSVKNKAHHQAHKKRSSKARRGDILDRNGHILASSRLLEKVILDPSFIHPDFIPKLAKALEMDAEKLGGILAKKKKIGSRYLVIKKNLTLTDPILHNLKRLKKQRIRICRDKTITQKLSLSDKVLNLIRWQTVIGDKKMVKKCRQERIGAAVTLRQDTQRHYPKSASMAALLGRVNAKNVGGSGIEKEFENILSGINGETYLNFTPDADKAYFHPQTKTRLRHGQNIELTIDTDIQYHAFEAIKKSVLKHEADSGSAIILAPNGEVLAMVNFPASDPNDKSLYNPSHYRNRVLSDKVEPGSTMKPFTMLLALEQGKISAEDDELIDVSKSIGHIKSTPKVRKYGSAITIKKILQKSHNLGTVSVSERLSKESMHETWYKLGFSQSLGLVPSIENSGSLKHFDFWGLADKRTLSFGHGPMETNLAQLAKAYLVFANDGAVLPLKLVNGAPNYTQKTQVFSKQTTDKIATLLDAVVSFKGSGYRARIKGYTVAGKTGTAEMVVDGKYHKDGAKRTFFTGFVPVKNPKYIMAVRLDYPKKCYVYKRPDILNSCEGSNSAAMVFKETMERVLSNDTRIKLSLNR
jgi:cell division protein FtsI (penicillin-binding protein 3)